MKGSILWQKLNRSISGGLKSLQPISQTIGEIAPHLKVLGQSIASSWLCLARKSATALTFADAGNAKREIRQMVANPAQMPRWRDASFPNAKPVHVISLVG